MIGSVRRRSKGDGWLGRKPRADGRWPASYVGSDGRRVYIYARDKADARRQLSAALRDLEAGLHVTGPGQTLAELLAVWLANKRASLAPSTFTRYAGLIKHHIVPAIGARPVRRIMPQDIAAFYLALGPRLSARSIQQVHVILHGAFAQAVAWHAVARSPVGKAAGVGPPRAGRPEIRFLHPAQARALLEAARGDPLSALYTAAVYTGLRLGELLALRWRDVDLERRALTVRHTLTLVDGAWTLRRPKTPNSQRTIVLVPAAAEALHAHRLAEARRLLALGHRIGPDSLIFTDRWGGALNAGHITERAFKPLLRRAGLPEIRFHDLRHTFASLMLSGGARIEVVSKMLGHASPATTLNVYAHLMPGDEEAAVRGLQALIEGAG